MRRRIIAFKGYYQEFMSKLSDQERKKVLRALLLMESSDKIPTHYIKYLEEEVFELKNEYYADKQSL